MEKRRQKQKLSHSSRPVAFSHLDKVFWPKEKYTKGDVIAYYEKAAPYILPFLARRPESLNRHPDGIEGPSFFQKNIGREHLPPFVAVTSVRAKTSKVSIKHVVCNNKETLLWLANFGCIELNPWLSSKTKINNPDYLVVDLDPHRRSFDDVVAVARTIHRLLTRAKVPALAKTSGKSGMHIMVPLGARYVYDVARAFAKLIAECVHEALPSLTTLEQRINKRKGKIYLDIARNAYGQTCAAPYSLRPYPGATVSTPLRWSEVKKGLRPSKFTIESVPQRLRHEGDLLKPLFSKTTDLRRAAKLLAARPDKAR